MAGLLFAGWLATSAAPAAVPSARDVLAGMESAWNKTDSFSCRMHVWTRRGSAEKVQVFDFLFKKPHLIRLKVQADPHKGADVVYRDGSIRGAEKILGIRFKKGLSRNDPDLQSLRGVPFWEADMGSQIELIRSLLPVAAASAQTVRQDGQNGAPAIILTLRWHGEDRKLHQGAHDYVTTWRLDGASFFPFERTTLEDGVKVEDVQISGLNRAAGLSEADFRL